MFYTFATIRYYSDRGTSVVRTLRPNLVASSLLIPNFSLADQVLEIFCTSSSISFLWPRALMFANRSIRLLDLLSGVLFLGHQVKFIVSESFENFQPFSAFPPVTVSWICSLVPRGFSLYSQFVGGGGNRSGTNGSQYQTQEAPKPLLYLLVVLASRNCISPLSQLQ